MFTYYKKKKIHTDVWEWNNRMCMFAPNNTALYNVVGDHRIIFIIMFHKVTVTWHTLTQHIIAFHDSSCGILLNKICNMRMCKAVKCGRNTCCILWYHKRFLPSKHCTCSSHTLRLPPDLPNYYLLTFGESPDTFLVADITCDSESALGRWHARHTITVKDV